MIRDKAGNLYGTTSGGGGTGCTGSGCGMVYKLDTTGQETVLHRFKNGKNGGGIWPPSGLIWNKAGNRLYGVTSQNAVGGSGGTVYELTP